VAAAVSSATTPSIATVSSQALERPRCGRSFCQRETSHSARPKARSASVCRPSEHQPRRDFGARLRIRTPMPESLLARCMRAREIPTWPAQRQHTGRIRRAPCEARLHRFETEHLFQCDGPAQRLILISRPHLLRRTALMHIMVTPLSPHRERCVLRRNHCVRIKTDGEGGFRKPLSSYFCQMPPTVTRGCHGWKQRSPSGSPINPPHP